MELSIILCKKFNNFKKVRRNPDLIFYMEILDKVLGFFNYKGLIVEKTKDGYIWNKKSYVLLSDLDKDVDKLLNVLKQSIIS